MFSYSTLSINCCTNNILTLYTSRLPSVTSFVSSHNKWIMFLVRRFSNGSIAIAKSQAGRCLELLDGDFTLNIKIQRYALEIWINSSMHSSLSILLTRSQCPQPHSSPDTCDHIPILYPSWTSTIRYIDVKIFYSIADCWPVADASLTGLGVSLYRLTEFFVLEFFWILRWY